MMTTRLGVVNYYQKKKKKKSIIKNKHRADLVN